MRKPFVAKRVPVVFIRVPKTGSTSVVRVCGGHKTQGPGWAELATPTHVLASQVDPEIVETYRDYTWIGGIRHPLSWIPSFWKWLEFRNDENTRTRWCGEHDGTWYGFVKAIKTTPFDWLENPWGIEVKPCPLETPEVIEEILGIKLPHINKTESLPAFNPDQKTLDLIETKFHRELQYYEPHA